jgi:hypothetical protein
VTAAAQFAEQRNAHAEAVVRWRLEQLVQAGYGLRDAERLARCDDVDLHQAVDLIRAGCPTELAVSILG